MLEAREMAETTESLKKEKEKEKKAVHANSKHWFTTSFLQLWRKVQESDARSVQYTLFTCLVSRLGKLEASRNLIHCRWRYR